MAYVTPKTWATNDLATAAQFNQDLRDNPAFLATPPSCRVFNSANISVATGSHQALTFNSERWDSQSLHSTSSLTGRITMPVAGKYLIGGCAEFAASATGQRGLWIRMNGTTGVAVGAFLDAAATGTTWMSVGGLYSFAASDYVELMAYQSSGGGLNVTVQGNYSPEFWACWQSL